MSSETMKILYAVRLCLFLYWISIFAVVQSTHEFTNQFAVHVPGGADEAKKVAARHGFAFHGQIGALENYYLFEHNHVHKRSAEPSEHHHQKLNAEPDVAWFEQQVNKKRTKRDYVLPDVDEMPWEAAGILEESDRLKRFNSGVSFGSVPQPSHADFQRSVSPANAVTGYTNFRDPFYTEQWYLHGGARGGYDMNVISCWKRGYSGKGVVISILDDGIQRDHPELALNYDPYASFDINDKDPDPMPQDNGDNKHGTRCAGEVSAVADNDVCGVGIAFNSSIGGVRMLDGPVNDAVEAHALSLNPDHIDIYSASWGPEDDGKTVDGPGPLARRAFINGIMKGRKGKGSIFVWASGNGGRHVDNCNCDGYTNSIFTLSISSATQRGLKPWYLEECASTLATTYSSGGPSSDKSVVTCDQDARLRPDRMCTVEHTGTSASAPIAAGICALALEANPNLTWRDMQYLVVMTSRPEPVLGERGWIVNGVKRKVSHKFGYGMMDADAMVTLAEKWSTVPSQHICQSRPDKNQRTIPAKYGGKMEASMSLDACAGTLNEVRYLEHVQCKISLRYLPRGNLRILLTSPMGTTSTLLFERPRDVTNANFDEWPFLSVHFWGEKADGTWVLQIINAGERRVAHPGLLRSWQLILYGTDINPVRLHSANARGKGLVSSSGGSAEFAESSQSAFGSTVDPFQPPVSPYIRPTNPAQEFSSGFFQLRSSFPNIFTLSGSSKVNSANVSDLALDSVAETTVVFDKTACHPECDGGCTGPGAMNCIRCRNVQFNKECLNECPFGTSPNSNGSCSQCHASCISCTGPGINQCLKCPTDKYYVADESLCVVVCPEGYLADEGAKHCIACGPHCLSCERSVGTCSSCDHHLVLIENKCSSSCPVKHYQTPEYKCKPCHVSCLTCTGKTNNQCVTCPYPSKLWEGTCVPDCPSGTYADEDKSMCLRCKAGCERCTEYHSCDRCFKNLVNGTDDGCTFQNKNECMKGSFPDTEGCSRCHPGCATCYGKNADQCLSCPASLFRLGSTCTETCPAGYRQQGSDCVECSAGCARCRNLDECLKCSEGLHRQGGSCKVSCESGYFSDRGDCKKCSASCSTCSGPKPSDCITCHSESRFADGTCVAECAKGSFATDVDGLKICAKCHRSCTECRGPKITDCSACPPNVSLNAGICSPCTGSQYYDQGTGSCKTCHAKCQTCNGPDEFSCSSCLKPLTLDPQQGRCVPCCSPRSQSGCCQCDSSGGCVNPEHHTRYAYDPAERLIHDQIPQEQSSFSTPGVIAAVFVLAFAVTGVYVIYRKVRSRASKYTYHQLPVNARSKSNLPVSDLSWNPNNGSDIRFGGLESEEELEQLEFIKA